MIKSKAKICFILATELSVKAFLLNHLKVLSQYYDITIITNTKNPYFLTEIGIPICVLQMNITRNINIMSDFKSLLSLVKILYSGQFSAVHSVTPKAGLLAMLASWLVGVPLRVHTFTGQVWVSKKGMKRFLLKRIDCLIAILTTDNIIDSPSQKQFLIDQGVLIEKKSLVFAKGSISGVDVAKFKPNKLARAEIRNDLELTEECLLFAFIGRLNVDKGVLDLAKAFSRISNNNLHLLFVGPDEQGMEAEIMKLQINQSNVHFVGHTSSPEAYMAAADVLCLPSYREGFGTVLIEAAAVGIPVIASRIYGITDAVVDHETGLLHNPHDIDSIQQLMESMSSNHVLRAKLGGQARKRVIEGFNSELITQAWVDFYQEKLGVA